MHASETAEPRLLGIVKSIMSVGQAREQGLTPFPRDLNPVKEGRH